MKIRNAKDFWSGITFLVFGLAFLYLARQYDMGTSLRMGPAYFPTVLGGLLALLGAVIALMGLGSSDEDGAVEKFYFGPLLWVLGGVTAFGVLLRPGGLVLALFVLIGVSALGSHESKLKEVVLLALGLAALSLAVFVWGLGMTIPVKPDPEQLLALPGRLIGALLQLLSIR